MTVRTVEGKNLWTGGKAIDVDREHKVISLKLRSENNLIIRDQGDNEIYVDLQLPDEITPTDVFPVGVTTGRVIVDNGWDFTGTIVCFKTTSGDNIKLYYADDGKLYIDNGTGLFKQIYLKGEVDTLLQALRDYVDQHMKVYTAGNGINIDSQDEISVDTTTIATKNYVDDSINQVAAYYITKNAQGDAFATYSELSNASTFYSGGVVRTPTRNDYCVILADETHNGECTRYSYQGTQWEYQYTINETSLTQAQLDALNSGITANKVSQYDGYATGKQDTLTAGNGIDIDVSNNISVDASDLAGNGLSASNGELQIDNTVVATQTDLTNGLAEKEDALTAGQGIAIQDSTVVVSDMKGPCPDGFHIPTDDNWADIMTIMAHLGNLVSSSEVRRYLLMPYGGYINYTDGVYHFNDYAAFYWSSTADDTDAYRCMALGIGGTQYVNLSAGYRAWGASIRPMKDTPVVPDSSWTALWAGVASDGIYWNSADGLISISDNGTDWITLSDKNLGATTPYFYGDVLSEANCGKLYQWGNNYAFPRGTGATFTKSTTQVDASNYGPGNYYSSSTFIYGNYDWDSNDSPNLWGGVTEGSSTLSFHTISSTVTEPTVLSGDTGVTYTLKVSNSDPASGTASNIITLVP